MPASVRSVPVHSDPFRLFFVFVVVFFINLFERRDVMKYDVKLPSTAVSAELRKSQENGRYFRKPLLMVNTLNLSYADEKSPIDYKTIDKMLHISNLV